MKTVQPKITLVGAGPGDIELITVKGLEAVKKADVILYDALVNEELLSYAPIAKKIFVGKRKGFKALSQEEINELLVQEALENGNVVRLKGGDSFVFGRGYEELLHAAAFGVETEVVPGISSSIAVPGLAGIPVTHRGVSNGFFVITASLSDGSLNPDLAFAAQTNATVVILMGRSKLAEITELFNSYGKGETSLAIISNGSLPNQQLVTGKVNEIANRISADVAPAPAIILIGDVVDIYHEKQQLSNEALFAEAAWI